MLRKVALLLLLMVMSLTTVLAEGLDLTQMTFDELDELRAKINAEMLTRPEAEDLVLSVGEYVVGRDLKPGTYYAIYDSGTFTAGSIYVYQDETKAKRQTWISVSPYTYDVYQLSNLQEGNLVVVEYNAIRVNMTGYPDYKASAGTEIPAGAYVIGTDIPAGRYTAHLNNGVSYIYVYSNADTYDAGTKTDSFGLAFNNRECVLDLAEGNILKIQSNSIIMNKYTPSFTFD